MGLYYFKDTWKLAFKMNTRWGFDRIATLAENCEVWNVPYSIFIEEPVGMRAIEVIVDVPSNAREGSSQRACVELPDRRRVDLVQWLDSYVPKEATPSA